MSNHERVTDGEETAQADEPETMHAVNVPERIVSRVDDRLPRSGFDSRDEYVAFVLEEVLYQVESRTEDESYDSTQEEEVTERLQSLGYLNE